jgi:hypothetical protein
MNRHPLELASWIAGILSAVVAVIVWLTPQKSSTEETHPKVQASITQATSGGNNAPSLQPPRKERPESESLPSDYLSSQLALADAIYGIDLRNAAYVKIIDQALERNDYASAKKIIAKIYGWEPRNLEYIKTIDQSIAQNRFEVAEELTPQIYGIDARNTVLGRLLDAKAKEAAAQAAHSTKPIASPDLARKTAQGM